MRFRFIDRIVSFEKGERSKLVVAKRFPPSDEFVAGHPLRPGEIPNCLVFEALATCAVRLVYSHSGERIVGLLLKVEEAKIMRAVKQSEEIVVHSELLGIQPEAQRSVGLARTRGQAFVDDQVVAEGRLVLLCFPKDGFEVSFPW